MTTNEDEGDSITLNEIKEQLNDVDFLQIFSTDLNGRPVTLQINPKTIDSVFERGVGFDGSSVPGYGNVEDSDRLLLPLAESFRIVHLKSGKLGFLIGKVNSEKGHRSKSDPRALLEKVISRAETDFGFNFLVGPEHEFFLLTGEEFSKDIHTDSAGYFHAARDKGEAVRKEIVDVLEKCGIIYEKTHHEVTASQHEINLEPLDPLEAADRTLLFNYVTQKVAENFGYHATFMPKPFSGQNRSAMHIHLSMMDLEGRKLFYQKDSDYNLTPKARQFIGGILKYARETSIIMASTFNSYKAYIFGKEAPIIRGWGVQNRSSMVRVPDATDPQNLRIELRNPDPGGNIYLQMATFIAMGLKGIQEKLDCGEPDAGNTYETKYDANLWDDRFLPRSMYEALVEAERSRFLREVLGDLLYEDFMALKVSEWEEHRIYISAKEHKDYLRI